MSLSLLAIVLGAGMGAPQIYGIINPQNFTRAARQFPRNLTAGIFLMLLGTAWFAWNVYVEPVADFSVFKPHMIAGFIAVGIASCIYVRDFLAVRGLAVVMLLLAKLMTDIGRLHLPTTWFHAQQGESSWVLVIQGWAYLFAVMGIWFTITPWRLRDFIDWATATEKRVFVGCILRLAFALFIIFLGAVEFHGM